MNYNSFDETNKKLCIGDWVRLVEIPPGIEKMPEETQIVSEKALGKTFRIEDFNKYGCAELDLTKKVAKYNTIRVEPHDLLLFRRKPRQKHFMTKKITVYEKPT
jgi:hypothetical protein